MSRYNDSYGDYPTRDYQQHGYQNQPYDAPDSSRYSDPFRDTAAASNSALHYPPQPDYSAQHSAASFDKYEPIGYGSGAGGVERDPSNPYAAHYSGSGGGMSNRKKWLIGGAVALVLIGVIAGIVGWRVSASKDSGDSSSDKSTTGGSSKGLAYIEGTAKVVKSNKDDPSQFEKDSRLHQSFWGMCYTPFHAQEPACGATQANVTEDIILLSQMTTRIRMYGSACNQSELVLNAIDQTKVNMTVWLGVYIGSDETVNEQQKTVTLDVLRKYGVDHVSGVTVGNEFLLNAVNKANAAQALVSHVADFKTRLAALNLPKTIPVGTADAGSEIRADLVAGVDFFMANTHAFFGGLLVSDAADWVHSYYTETDVPILAAAPNAPTGYIAETGWPTGSMTAENATYQGAVASVANLQVFLDDYVCAANTNGSQYFYFSPFAEPWKEQFGGVEPYWGLHDSNKQLLVTIPDCTSP